MENRTQMKMEVWTMMDTAELMVSGDYRERFQAEYLQTKIRYERLKRFNTRLEAARLKGEAEERHDCPNALLQKQQAVMAEYLRILEVRAEIEGVDIDLAIYS